MKALRVRVSLVAIIAAGFLAACGGGGGGGSVTPPGGGGGGGSTPTPHPSSSPTSSPTTSPTTSPTISPTTSPTSTPAGVTVQSGWTLTASENVINNYDPHPSTFWYTSGNAPWSNTAGYTSTSAATSGQVDGMSCVSTPEGVNSSGQPAFPATAYTTHAFVGIFDPHGKEQVLPQAIGLYQPQAPTTPGSPNAPNGHPSNTYAVELYNCSYNVHTHDYSGMVHIEDTNVAQGSSTPQYANLQTLLDLWGATLDMNAGLTAGANQISGPVTIYTGTPGANGLVSSYTQYTGSAPFTGLMLNPHTVIWIVIGTNAAGIPPFKAGNTSGLPQVQWKIVN